MRNPWKKGEWTGRFSDKSDDWTEALKAECGWTDKDDGLFWMPFDEMMNVFDVVDICKYDDKAKFSFAKVSESSSGYALIPFTVKKTCKSLCTFAVSQRGSRTEEAEGNHEFDQNCYARKVTIGIAKVTNPNANSMKDSVTAIDKFEKEKTPYAVRDHYLEFKSLEAGDYYLYADIDWDD
jgi:hypothetical protein